MRPYAWKTFAKYAREHFMETGDWRPKRGTRRQLTPWQDGACASPRVLVLGAYAALRVRGGALEIEHGPHDERQTIRIDIDAEPKPHTILFDSHGEFLTGEAIRWCARYSINLVLPGGPGRIDHDGRERAGNENEYDDAHARNRSDDHSGAVRG